MHDYTDEQVEALNTARQRVLNAGLASATELLAALNELDWDETSMNQVLGIASDLVRNGAKHSA